MGLGAEQSWLLISLLLLLTRVRPGRGSESISYTPQLSSAALAGKLTQSTFTLEQPLGHFDQLSISDLDPIWLVVAHSNATQAFTAPQRDEDIPAPASFAQNSYYLTLRANRIHYRGSQAGSQLRVLRVGNDTRCSLMTQGCNSPLPGSGPYRVKFLVMNNSGPVAETEWSSELRLQEAQALQTAPGSQSAGTVVIIAFLSILLAVLLAILLVLLIYNCFGSCGSTSVSSPGGQVRMRTYNNHYESTPPGAGAS